VPSLTPSIRAASVADETHPAPNAADRCNIWLTLRTRDVGTSSRHGLTHEAPPLFLHLRSSGLLLGLPDEDPTLLDSEAAEVTIKIRDTDALGLGLAASDFRRGVGVCGGPERGSLDGWRCRDAKLIGLDGAGREWPLSSPESFSWWLG
jgi:hypothetical protein